MKEEAKKAQQAEAAKEAIARVLIDDGSTPLGENDDDIPACLLLVGSPESSHEQDMFQYVSLRSREGDNGERAPTIGEMQGLKGLLVVDANSIFRGRVGVSTNHAITQWRRQYKCLVSWISHAGLSPGGAAFGRTTRQVEMALAEAIAVLPDRCDLKHVRVPWNDSVHVEGNPKQQNQARQYVEWGKIMEFNDFSGPDWTKESH